VDPKKLQVLCCPECKSDLKISKARTTKDGRIEEGELACVSCDKVYPIIRYIPRFCSLDNYANSFGYEWNAHVLTQYDHYTGVSLSEERFFKWTNWERDLHGQKVLEIGCGAGRHTIHAADTGADLVCIDLSNAVEANYKMNGHRENVLIVQADAYRPPLRLEYFDKVFVFGILPAMPDPRAGVIAFQKCLKPGGQLVVDAYRTRWWFYLAPRLWIRPITKRMNPATLHRLIEKWVNLMWPIVRRIRKLPGGRMFNRGVLVIADYGGFYDLSEKHLKEWAILDTFDGLSPMYEKREKPATVGRWFEEAGLIDLEVFEIPSDCVIGRGRKPA